MRQIDTRVLVVRRKKAKLYGIVDKPVHFSGLDGFRSQQFVYGDDFRRYSPLYFELE